MITSGVVLAASALIRSQLAERLSTKKSVSYIWLGGFYMAQTHTTTIDVQVDENVKRNVEVLFDDMGMNINSR